VRNPAILQQTDHRGYAHGNAGGVQEVAVFFFRHGDPLQYQHDRSPRGAYVDGLIGGIQYQHGLMQRVAITVGVHARGEHRRRKVRPHAAAEIVQSQRHDLYP